MSAEEASRIARAAERVRRTGGAMKIAVPTAAALGAGAALAIGSIGGTGTTITGCYVTSPQTIPQLGGPPVGVTGPAGALRVIDPSANTLTIGGAANNACAPNEATIAWDQQGPTGPAGTPGAQGAQGAQGVEGPLGSAGGVSLDVGGATAMFIKFDGIDGESKDKDHKSWSDLKSFSFGATNVGTGAGGGGAGKTTVQTFEITKVLDSASPLLAEKVGSGAAIKFVDVDFASGHKVSPFLKYEFKNVAISSDKVIANGNGVPTEELTFTFSSMQIQYETENSAGKVSAGKAIGITIKNNTL
jgi:type VI secretion system secreted protein Hcp